MLTSWCRRRRFLVSIYSIMTMLRNRGNLERSEAGILTLTRGITYRTNMKFSVCIRNVTITPVNLVANLVYFIYSDSRLQILEMLAGLISISLTISKHVSIALLK